MKGTITNCLAELVETKFGTDQWKAIVAHARIPEGLSIRMAFADIEEGAAGRLFQSTSVVLGQTPQQTADIFGEYWSNTYAPRMYKVIFNRFKNAREMILGMDAVHVEVTSMIANARPPRFEYRWENAQTLLVTYRSKRNMIAIYIGLVRGLGTYFREKLSVDQVGLDQVRIRFPS